MNVETGEVHRIPEEISEEEARSRGYAITDKHPTDYMNRKDRRAWQAQQRQRSTRKKASA